MMRSSYITARLLTIILFLTISACGGSATQAPPQAGDTPAELAAFDSAKFTHSTQVDNAWFPLTPGTQFVYDGVTVEDGQEVPHQIIITVTDLTKVIGGVRAVVTWDRDLSDGELVEAELAFFAQDDDGNVWRMGEYPEEYENGQFTIAPTWMHGFQEARAGIAMQADPQTDTPSYAQGWGPAVGWTDRGQVDAMGQEVCVPQDCYQDVLVIAETSASEPDAIQLKSYAQGVGNIRTDWRGEDQTQEVLELSQINQLSPEQLAEARAQAILLETHAYQVSTDMYANTSPVEYPEGTPAVDISAIPVEQGEAGPAAGDTVPAGSPDLVVAYASDLTENALYEMEFWDDPASPGGRLIGIPNGGEEMDPPPENDPHVTFTVQVLGDVPYRCWVHMKVGEPGGVSQANLVWVQLSGATDQTGGELFRPDSNSYLTAQGTTTVGWQWVPCDQDGAVTLIYFEASGEVTVRIQAGMEGVGFDQFVLSSDEYLELPPAEAVIER